MHAYIHTDINTYMHACMCKYAYVDVCVYVCVYMYICICMHLRTLVPESMPVHWTLEPESSSLACMGHGLTASTSWYMGYLEGRLGVAAMSGLHKIVAAKSLVCQRLQVFKQEWCLLQKGLANCTQRLDLKTITGSATCQRSISVLQTIAKASSESQATQSIITPIQPELRCKKPQSTHQLRSLRIPTAVLRRKQLASSSCSAICCDIIQATAGSSQEG